jgi:hypothetical protein
MICATASWSPKRSIAEGQAMLKRLGEVRACINATPESIHAFRPHGNLPLAAYQSAVERFNLLRTRERELSLVFTAESPRLRDVTAEVKAAEAKKIELEKAHPGLLKVRKSVPPLQRSPVLQQDDRSRGGKRPDCRARHPHRNPQAAIGAGPAEAANVDRAELVIQELERRKTIEETNYRYFAATLEQTRINEALGAGRVTNISPVQNPSPPAPVRNKSTRLPRSPRSAASHWDRLGLRHRALSRSHDQAGQATSAAFAGHQSVPHDPRQRARRKLRRKRLNRNSESPALLPPRDGEQGNRERLQRNRPMGSRTGHARVL